MQLNAGSRLGVRRAHFFQHASIPTPALAGPADLLQNALRQCVHELERKGGGVMVGGGLGGEATLGKQVLSFGEQARLSKKFDPKLIV